jgi:hypothetical protein
MNKIELTNNDQIKHEEAKNQLLKKRINTLNRINKINNAIIKMPPPPRFKRGKDFKQDMSNIVKGQLRF